MGGQTRLRGSCIFSSCLHRLEKAKRKGCLWGSSAKGTRVARKPELVGLVWVCTPRCQATLFSLHHRDLRLPKVGICCRWKSGRRNGCFLFFPFHVSALVCFTKVLVYAFLSLQALLLTSRSIDVVLHRADGLRVPLCDLLRVVLKWHCSAGAFLWKRVFSLTGFPPRAAEFSLTLVTGRRRWGNSRSQSGGCTFRLETVLKSCLKFFEVQSISMRPLGRIIIESQDGLGWREHLELI